MTNKVHKLLQKIHTAVAGMADVKTCPQCGKYMIKRGTGGVLTTYPAQHPQIWWCKCGHTETAPTIYAMTEDEIALQKWQRANGEES